MLNHLICRPEDPDAERHVELDVLYSAEPPACGECGAPRSIWWGSGEAPRSVFFRPVDLGDGTTLDSKEEAEAYRTRMAERHGIPVENLQFDAMNGSTARRRAEEFRHRAWQNRRKAGLDDKSVAEIKQTVRETGVNPKNGLVDRNFSKRVP